MQRIVFMTLVIGLVVMAIASLGAGSRDAAR
jgi:hypothetical protein